MGINDVPITDEITIEGNSLHKLSDEESGSDDAYKTTDSASTTINDTDYIPLSDANGNRKKSLWSNIVEKIKTALGIASSGDTYLKKDGTWGTPTNTTYTFATGDSNGQIKVTPSGEISHNVSVKGLKSAAYIDADKSGTANTIVQRTGYGYINAGNSATENPASYTAYAVFQDSDGYYRKATKDVFKSWLGITTGTWTPQIYDNNTFKRNLATSNYYKVGNIIMAYYAGYNPDLSGISTMLQIRNFPGKVYGGQMYIAADAAGGAQLTVQGSGNNAVYFRPNWVSSRISNPSAPGNVTALIWGIE